MSKQSPAKYENLAVANATLDATEDEVSRLNAENLQLRAKVERLEKALADALDCMEQNTEDPDVVAIGIVRAALAEEGR